MVEDDPGAGALLDEIELGNRINARGPGACPPSLHNSLVWHKLHVSSRDVAAEEGECASRVATYLRGLVRHVHGLHDSAEFYDLVELFGVGERLVDALSAGLEDRFLMNGFRRAGDLLLNLRPHLVEPTARPPNATATPMMACRRVGSWASAARFAVSLIGILPGFFISQSLA
jgi:hypothetical protein